MKTFKYNEKDYLAFWGGVFSQWSLHGFDVYGKNFMSAEHYMMYMKAKLFNDEEIANRILRCTDPKEAKSLGRQVKNFDQKIWDENKIEIVTNGNFHKFKQNPELLEMVKKYQKHIFVEGSPYDKIWGVGLHWQSKEIENPNNWKGQNLLGKCINNSIEMLKDLKII